MEQQVIFKGSRAVSIVSGSKWQATLYVNCENGQLGGRTLVSHKFSTIAGARKWADMTLAHDAFASTIEMAYA